MRKYIGLLVMLAGGAVLAFTFKSLPGLTQTTYTATATMPDIVGINVAVSRIIYNATGPDDWIPMNITTLDFGNLKEFSGTDSLGRKWIVYLPENGWYYALDVGLVRGPGGGGFTSIDVQHDPSQDLKPAGATEGLEVKSCITYVKTVLINWENSTTNDIYLDRTTIRTGRTTGLGDIQGGWLRLYVGIVSLDPNATGTWPGDAKVFGPTDPVGTYQTGFTISLL